MKRNLLFILAVVGLLVSGLTPHQAYGDAPSIYVTNIAVQAQPNGSAQYRVCVTSSATPITGFVEVRGDVDGSDVSIPLTQNGVDCGLPNTYLLVGSYKAPSGRAMNYHFVQVLVEVPNVVAESLIYLQPLPLSPNRFPLGFVCSVNSLVSAESGG